MKVNEICVICFKPFEYFRKNTKSFFRKTCGLDCSLIYQHLSKQQRDELIDYVCELKCFGEIIEVNGYGKRIFRRVRRMCNVNSI